MLHQPWQIGISVYHDNDIFTLSFGDGFEGPTVNHIFFVATGVDFVPGLSWLPGTRYQGQFRDNIREGYGVLTAPPACSLAGLLDVFLLDRIDPTIFWMICWMILLDNIRQATNHEINKYLPGQRLTTMSMTLLFLIFVPQGGFYLKAIVTPSPMQICSLPVHGWQPVWRGLVRRCTRGRLEKGRLVDAEMVFWRVLPVYLWIPFETKFNECMDFALTIKHIYIAFSILCQAVVVSGLRTTNGRFCPNSHPGQTEW